ncbi:MAG: hypothetical protein O7G84_00840 [Gammaproteobacteria bacterium]|nr:hypothetical protein [Gammaproteobacteria bacterium]
MMTTHLSDIEYAAHMRDKRDARPMLTFVWDDESRLYAHGIDMVGNPTEVRMGSPSLTDMTRAAHMIPGIIVHEVSGTPNHNGNAWHLRVEYSAKRPREFDRLVL